MAAVVQPPPSPPPAPPTTMPPGPAFVAAPLLAKRPRFPALSTNRRPRAPHRAPRQPPALLPLASAANAANASASGPEPWPARDADSGPSTPSGSLSPASSSTDGAGSARDDESLSQKVESAILASEQTTPDAPPPPPARSRRVLPVTLDLLNYHARTLARDPGAAARAERLYRRCIALDPGDGRAWLGLARLQRDADSARAVFRKAVGACPRNAYLQQAWGVLEERVGDLHRAKTLYLAAIRSNEKHAPAWVALGLWLQRHGRDVTAARAALRRGAEADPGNYYVWHVWGMLERESGRPSVARECFRRGVDANPANAATYVAWGSLEDELGRSEAALPLFERAHTASPKNVQAYVSHAVAAERAGDPRKARELLLQAIRVRPRAAGPRQALALLEFRGGDVNRARKLFREALDTDAKHCPTFHAWARVEQAAGNIDKARTLFQEAVWAAPRAMHVTRTWHSWATLEADQGNLSTARRYFLHGLEVDARSVPLLVGLARVEARVGDMPRVRELLEDAVRVAPWRRSTWREYEALEGEHGSAKRAQLVFERAVVVEQQVEERYIVSGALPGDFNAGGMWIDPLELKPDQSALEAVGFGAPAAMRRAKLAAEQLPPAAPRRARSSSPRAPGSPRAPDASEDLVQTWFKPGQRKRGSRSRVADGGKPDGGGGAAGGKNGKGTGIVSRRARTAPPARPRRTGSADGTLSPKPVLPPDNLPFASGWTS